MRFLLILILSISAWAQGGGVNVAGGNVVFGGKALYGGSGPPTCTPVAGHSYSTSFPLVETPISECNSWINGLATGLDWNNVNTTAAFAKGTQASGITDDSTAVLIGSWLSDQQVQTTVLNSTATSDAIGKEDEHRLRSTMTAHSSTGYEVDWGPYKTTASTCYLVIVRWNGPFNNFTYIANLGITNATYCHTTGDVLLSTVVGSTIRTFKNGIQQAFVNDTTYTNGTPGMGFDAGVGAAIPNDWGFSAFSATDAFIGMGQSVALNTAVSGTTVAPVMPTNTTTGNLIACMGYWADTARTGSVSDVANGTYTAIDSPVNGLGGISTYRAQAFYKANITGATTPTITLTLSGSAATVDRSLACHEVKIAGGGVLDQHPAAKSASTGPATQESNTTSTTTAANEYLFGWCLNGNSTLTSPWNLAEFTNFAANPTGFRVVSATGTYFFQSTGGATDFVCGIDTFK